MYLLATASKLTDDLYLLCVVDGLAYGAFAVASFAAALLMLRGDAERMRVWAIVGVLFVPLPGIMCPTMEVTPSLQLVWPLLAWIWAGRPWRWSPVVVIAAVLLYGLHPLAGPLFVMVAAVAWFHDGRSTVGRWFALAFTVVAVMRLWQGAAMLDDYERSQLAIAKIGEEVATVLLLAPFAVVVVLAFWTARASLGGHDLGHDSLSPLVWALVLALGLFFFHDSRFWAGSFNYRKFGVITLAPFVWLAAREAKRGPGHRHPLPRLALLTPCMVFVALLAMGCWSWQRELARLRDAGAAVATRVVEPSAIPGLVETPLFHWSGTVVSILLQGRRPQWVLRSYGVTLVEDGIQLWPSETALKFRNDEDVAFDLSGLRP
jgi:hypothetical protein